MVAPSRRAFQVVLWIFAGIGLIYVCFVIVIEAVLPRVMCQGQMPSTVFSTDGLYFARFDRTICPAGAGESRGEVGVGKTTDPSRSSQVLRVPPTTNDVKMTWQGPRQLVLTVPDGTVASGLNPHPSDYDITVVLRTAPHPQD
jgi:hypothetical protein